MENQQKKTSSYSWQSQNLMISRLFIADTAGTVSHEKKTLKLVSKQPGSLLISYSLTLLLCFSTPAEAAWWKKTSPRWFKRYGHVLQYFPVIVALEWRKRTSISRQIPTWRHQISPSTSKYTFKIFKKQLMERKEIEDQIA